MKTQKNKRNETVGLIINLIILFIILFILLYIAIEISYNQGTIDGYENASSEFTNYSIAGYNQRAIEVNNMLIRDLSIYGYANYPIYYNNETFNLRCEVIQ